MAPHSKCGWLARASWVQIPPLPPPFALANRLGSGGIPQALAEDFSLPLRIVLLVYLPYNSPEAGLPLYRRKKLNSLFTEAADNLRRLTENPYPGRGLILGRDETGEKLVQVYWIMGRSDNSRNRVFEDRGNGNLWTAAADPAKVADPSLIIYRAMAETTTIGDMVRGYVVSNGHQTDAVIDAVKTEDEVLLAGLEKWQYEPDAPNFTPRITGLFETCDGDADGEIMLLKKSPFGDGTVRILHKHDYPFEAKSLGLCVTTYMGDGDPFRRSLVIPTSCRSKAVSRRSRQPSGRRSTLTIGLPWPSR